MIETEDINAIDQGYFELINISEYYITIQSRNTGHFWHLLERVANDHRTFVISHRHGGSGPYHLQQTRSKPSIEACCDYIKDHDAYQARKDMAKEQRRQKNRRRHMGAMDGS